MLPPGSEIQIDASTFRQVSDSIASVEASVSRPDGDDRVLLDLVLEDEGWLVYGTKEISG